MKLIDKIAKKIIHLNISLYIKEIPNTIYKRPSASILLLKASSKNNSQ